MRNFTEKYGGLVVLCCMSLSLLCWFYWYKTRPVGNLMVILTISEAHKEIKKNSLAEVVTAQFARENLKVRGQSPEYSNEGGMIKLRYTRLPEGNVKETFEIPKCAEEVVDATIKEGDEVEKRLELFHPPEKLTLINETGSDLKILRIRSGAVKEKTTAVDKDLVVEGSLDLEKSYREGEDLDTGKERTILVLKRDGFRELEVPVNKTPFPITAALFEGQEEQAVVKLQFNESTTTHNEANFKSFIRDEIKPAVKISAMDESGQWQERAIEGVADSSTTNSTVTVRYRGVPIGVKGKLQVTIEYKFYEKFIITNSDSIVDGGEWLLTAKLECVKPKVTITPSIETKIDGPKGVSYPLRISVKNKASVGSQSATAQEIEKSPYQFTLEPFAEYQLIINGEGIEQVTRELKAYDPGLIETYPVMVSFETDKEKKWLELEGDITPEDLAADKRKEFAGIVEGASINLVQALDQLDKFYREHRELILKNRFNRRLLTIRNTHFPPAAPKYKTYINIEDFGQWEKYDEQLEGIKKSGEDSGKGVERIDMLKAVIELAYNKVYDKEFKKSDEARKKFAFDADEKQRLVEKVDPKGYVEFIRLWPTDQKLEADPLDYRSKLEEAEDLLDDKYYGALKTELDTYRKTLMEFKAHLEGLGNKDPINSPQGDRLLDKFKSEPLKEQYPVWMDDTIRPLVKYLFVTLIDVELKIIEKKGEVDPDDFERLKLAINKIRQISASTKPTPDSLYEEPEAYSELKDLRQRYKAFKEGYLEKVNKKMADPKTDLKEVWVLYREATKHFPNEAKGFNWGDNLKTEVTLTEGKGEESAVKIGIPQGADELKITIIAGHVSHILDHKGVNKRRISPGQKHLVKISYKMSSKLVEYATRIDMDGAALELNTIKGKPLRPVKIAGKFEPFGRINLKGKATLYFKNSNGTQLSTVSIPAGEWVGGLGPGETDRVVINVNGDLLEANVHTKLEKSRVDGNLNFFVKLLNTPKAATVKLLGGAKKFPAEFKIPLPESAP